MLIGTNDLGQNYETNTVIARLDGLISNITTNRPNAKVIVANLLPRGDNIEPLIETIFNPYVPGLVAQHAARGEQVYFWDMHSKFTTNDLDGTLHPNPTGYQKLGQQWFYAVNDLLAPCTSANLALNQVVTASSVDNAGDVASNAVDGNFNSFWGSAAAGHQWIYVDLGSLQNISRLRWVWTAAYATSYVVQVSTNATSWTTVYNTTLGTGGTNSVAFAPTNARYVRVFAEQAALSSGYGLAELQAYASRLVNLALNKTVTASSTLDPVNQPAANVVDGNTNSSWSAKSDDYEWIAIDLGSVQTVGGVQLNWQPSYGQSYEIQVSTDNVTWTRVYNTSSGTGGIENITFTAVNARYVRMYGLQRGTANGYSLSEFGVYAPQNSPASNQFQPLVYVPQLTPALGQNNTRLALSWSATAQQPYGVQYAANLTFPVWYDYEPQVINTGTVASILLPLTSPSQQFFRVKPAF